MPAPPAENLRLGAVVSRQDVEFLQIQWTLDNASEDTIVVLRHLFRAYDTKGRLKVEPNLVYVFVQEDGRIDIGKELIPVPSGIQIGTPFVPLGEELPSGRRVTEAVTLRLPIGPWNHYDDLIALATGFRGMHKVPGKQICFRMGVYKQGAGISARTIDTSQGKLLYPSYKQLLKAQMIVSAPPIPWGGDAYRH